MQTIDREIDEVQLDESQKERAEALAAKANFEHTATVRMDQHACDGGFVAQERQREADRKHQ